MEAANFAAIKHKDQRRKDKDETPYINHPIGVARILSHEASIDDVEILQAALLHDTVEDTDCSFEEIDAKFGEKVNLTQTRNQILVKNLWQKRNINLHVP